MNRPHAAPDVRGVCSDQFRPDFIEANRESPLAQMPHLDAFAESYSDLKVTQARDGGFAVRF